MSLHWIFGGSGFGKSHYVYNKIMQQAAADKMGKYIIIVPEQFTMQTQKDMVMMSENKGIMNKIAQKFFKKPRISYIHLDDSGSFVWLLIDGKSSVYDIAASVEKHFGDAAKPLYERLIGFFSILDNNRLIIWIE